MTVVACETKEGNNPWSSVEFTPPRKTKLKSILLDGIEKYCLDNDEFSYITKEYMVNSSVNQQNNR
jgi:hypothetical protein